MKPKTPEQLNQLNIEAAEMMGDVLTKCYYFLGSWSTEDEVIHQREANGLTGMPEASFWSDESFSLRCGGDKWNPTDKNSAQAQNYLIPRLIEKGWSIDIIYNPSGQGVVCIHPSGLRIDKSCENHDEINATITEVYILAIKKLKEIANHE